MDITKNALNVAVEGLKASEGRVVKAVEDIQFATLAASNVVNGAGEGEEALVADAVRGALVPVTEGDISKPIVDLLQAKFAYQANAFAVKVTADVESELTRVLKRLV